MGNWFETKGEISQAAMVLPLFLAAEKGEVVTYEQMSEKLGFDARASSSFSTIIRTVGDRLRTENQQEIEAVRNRGYRLVYPWENRRLAEGQIRQAIRKTKRAHDVYKNTPLDQLRSDEERLHVHLGQASTAAVLGHMRKEQRKLAADSKRLTTLGLSSTPPGFPPIPRRYREGPDLTEEIRQRRSGK